MAGEEQTKSDMPVFVVSEECGKAINEALQRSDYNKLTGSSEITKIMNQTANSTIIESFMEVHPACPREDFKVPNGPFQIKGEGKGPARK